MSETNYSCIFDERVPRRTWSFHQKAVAAVFFLLCFVPLLSWALFILLPAITGGLSLPVMS